MSTDIANLQTQIGNEAYYNGPFVGLTGRCAGLYENTGLVTLETVGPVVISQITLREPGVKLTRSDKYPPPCWMVHTSLTRQNALTVGSSMTYNPHNPLFPTGSIGFVCRDLAGNCGQLSQSTQNRYQQGPPQAVGGTGSSCAHPRHAIWNLIIQLLNITVQRDYHDDNEDDDDENDNGEGHCDWVTRNPTPPTSRIDSELVG